MNKRFKPQYLPYNDDAHALVEALAVAVAVELGLTLKGITGAKHKTPATGESTITSSGFVAAAASFSNVSMGFPLLFLNFNLYSFSLKERSVWNKVH